MTAAASPCSHPLANALTRGFRTPIERIPENQATMSDHMEIALRAFSPRTPYHLWLSDDIGLMLIRLDRVARMERRVRDMAALRAEFFWDDDRQLLAVDLGARLARDPGRIVPKLRSTPQGCDWLIERWGWLKRVLDDGSAWDEGQVKLALDLLGTPKEVRANAAGWLTDPAATVRAEVAALEAQKARVAESDALDRAMAMADVVEPDTVEFRRLRRYETSLHKRMRWSIDQLDLMPKFKDPHPDFIEWRHPSWVPDVMGKSREPLDAESGPEIEPVPETEVEPGPETPPRPAPANPPPPEMTTAPRSRRPDPEKLRARARKAARQRRKTRPDR